MELMVYIFPAALFVLTMIILFILRSEDSKSRTLKNINDTLANFRSEATQTTKRIQEATHDCLEAIDKKRFEVDQIIENIDQGLKRLQTHHDDLVNLEGICKSYEVALQELKMETEKTEDRIAAVQKEVEKAEAVSETIHAFEEAAERVKQELRECENGYRALVERTEEELNKIAEEHQQRENEMLGMFTDELGRKREEFASYANSIIDDIDSRRNDITSFVVDANTELDEKKTRINSDADICIENIGKKVVEAESYITNQNNELNARKEEFDAYFLKRCEENEANERAYSAKVDENRKSLEALHEELEGQLRSSSEQAESSLSTLRTSCEDIISSTREDLERRVSELRASIDEDGQNAASSLSSLRTSCELVLSQTRESLEDRGKELATEADQKVNESRNAIQGSIEDMKSEIDSCTENLDNHCEELKSSLAASIGAMKRDIAECSESLRQQNEALKSDLERSISDMKVDIADCSENLRQQNEALKADMGRNVDDMKVDIADCSDILKLQNEELKEDMNKSIESMKADIAACSDNLEKQSMDLKEDMNKSIESMKADIAACSDNLEKQSMDLKENLAQSIVDMKADIAACSDNLRRENEDLKRDVDERIVVLNGKNDAIISSAESLRISADNKVAEANENLNASLASAKATMDSHVEEALQRVDERYASTISELSAKTSEAESNIARTCDEAKQLHQDQKDLISREEKVYIETCRSALSAALSEEVSKVDGLFKSMSSSAISNIENLGRSQTELKESVSWLNQGVNETIANTVDRLQDLQNKIIAAEERLHDTNDSVTRTKEDLLNLQVEHRDWQAKVDKAVKEADEADHRFKAIKQQRINEESRLVKLKMEISSYEGTHQDESASRRGKRSNVEMEKFPENLGEEEDLLSPGN